MALTTIKAECHCKSNSFDIQFLASLLPISTKMCHCNACRHSTGQLYVHAIPIHGVPLATTGMGKAADLQHLKQYQAKPQTSHLFCKTCNAFFFTSTKDDLGSLIWSVFPGVLERVEGLFAVNRHEFVEETCDGGIADHYRRADNSEIVHYKTAPQDDSVLPMNWTTDSVALSHTLPLSDDATIDIYCHCKSIQLTLFRPLKHILPTDGPFIESPNPASIQPQHGLRYLAAHCFCNSCRLTSGSTTTGLCFAPCDRVIDKRTSKPAITFSMDGSGTLVKQFEGANQYQSSPNKFRESCAKCGAHVMYWDAKRPNGFIDLFPGLFDQEAEGARAERYFSWKRTLFDGDAVDLEAVKVLRDGMQEYYGVPAGIWPEV